MPRGWSEYSVRDWAKLRPLLHAIKTARYRAIDAAYRRAPAATGDLAALHRRLEGRQVLVTVAFADAEATRWQTALVRHYVPSAVHVIADNSPTDAAADAVRRITEAAGTAYVRLPPNPWLGKEPSRSHGAALNWIWANLIRPARPAAFGFIDHDLFPTAPDDPFAPLATHTVCGPIRRVGARWFLWAGFALFRFDRVASLPLNFGQDWFAGLDTGGGNWDPLYRRLAPQDVCEIETRVVPFKPGIDWPDGPLQWFGPWLHEVGLMGRPELFDEKRLAVEALIAPHLLAAGAPPATAVVPGAPG
ncbi:hypothetical protein CCR97_24730 [Rhodoplanes elegans]|uniref:Glycosyltransferase n=1 Tax=Rhodoplanes elegans TaxID=29408 RepID=A0A327KDT4_9BRAD|nr:hypothetical protein [Rhodoplanes elegans]MBK5961386.1 hypothetical protein [Rhodoplanes elegans]RAI36166.1 hypothetical protein CH338_17995 [Rhodoplanes elegans]